MVPLGDVAVIALAMKGHLVDLSAESSMPEDAHADYEQHVQAILEVVARLEGVL